MWGGGARTAVIMLKILGRTTQNFAAHATGICAFLKCNMKYINLHPLPNCKNIFIYRPKEEHTYINTADTT